MPDRQTFDGRLVSLPSQPGAAHVIHLESTMVKMVDEAVKCAMEGTEDLERFVVTPQPPKPKVKTPQRSGKGAFFERLYCVDIAVSMSGNVEIGDVFPTDQDSSLENCKDAKTSKKTRSKRDKGEKGDGNGKDSKQCIIVSHSHTPGIMSYRNFLGDGV